MSSMNDRERAFESKFALDEEQKFKALVRRNKIVGRWAAGLLGKDAETYASEVVAADFEKLGDEDVIEKLQKDFDAAGVAMTDAEIRRKMQEALAQAVTEVAG